jgi:DNA-binding response OmpR family regulator
MKILCIYYKENFGDFLISGLESDSFVVDKTHCPKKGICLADSREYDIILIQNKKNYINAFDICKEIRENDNSIPILMILSEYNLEKLVDALINGFDDVLSTNTPLIEIIARIKRLIKRSKMTLQLTKLQFGNLELDIKNNIIKHKGEDIRLRKKEYELLEYMLYHQNEVLSRKKLLAHVWPEETFMFTNTVDVHISSIRRKMENKLKTKLIETIHGIGYKINFES